LKNPEQEKKNLIFELSKYELDKVIASLDAANQVKISFYFLFSFSSIN